MIRHPRLELFIWPFATSCDSENFTRFTVHSSTTNSFKYRRVNHMKACKCIPFQLFLFLALATICLSLKIDVDSESTVIYQLKNKRGSPFFDLPEVPNFSLNMFPAHAHATVLTEINAINRIRRHAKLSESEKAAKIAESVEYIKGLMERRLK